MELDSVRELKSVWSERVYSRVADRLATGPGEVPQRPPERAFGLALGAAVLPTGGYGLAVRYAAGTPGVRGLVAELVAAVGEAETDVRCLGTVRPLTSPGIDTAGALRTRLRPVVPGASVAHVAVTAGTLGGFVSTPAETRPLLLSNSHVLAESGLALLGDPVVQPGPADGGDPLQDRIGELAAAVPLPTPRTPGPPTVDAALARLDDAVDLAVRYPAGALTGTAVALGGEAVAKIGRTTGPTAGRVSAIEVDDVVVDYGPGVGLLRFDGQLEVSGSGPGPFSRGGDSGSLVVDVRSRAALGLLFAGSEFGGPDGLGLTFCNPIGDVLGALGAELVLG